MDRGVFLKNNSIALLVGVLIILSVAAILIGPKQTTYIRGITGHATGDSNVLFNMSEETSILVTDAINFGAGNVYSNASFAILDSESGTGGGSSFGWQNVTGITGNKPTNKSETVVVYDKALDVFILYGGDNSPNETWMFNYSNKEWTNLTNPEDIVPFTSPYQSFNGTPWLTSMVYDSSIGEIILFGGFPGNVGDCTGAGSCASNETWEFNLSMRWEKLSPSGDSPPAVAGSSMAFDSKRNVTVLFGGGLVTQTVSNETWEYDASSNTWANKTGDIAPPARSLTTLAFDSDRNVTVLFGGTNGYEGMTYGDTWEYNGTDWANITTVHSPLARAYAGMTYDSARKVVILAGGADENGTFLNDTWEYNGTDWADTGYTFYGASLTNFHVVFDPQIEKTLLFSSISYVWNETTEGYDSFYVDDVQEYGNITSGGGGGGGCINGTWSFGPSFIYVENDGTVNISIDYTANKAAGTFIGGTSPSFKIKGVVDEAGACPSIDTTYTEVSDSVPNEICPILKYENNADRIKIPSRLIVPSDVASGTHNSTITLTATWVGGPA